MEIPKGYCQCGCGGLAPIAKYSWKEKGWVEGQPKRFISGHNMKGTGRYDWRDGKYKSTKGYFLIKMPDHPRACKGYVFEHILRAERALGKFLPPDVVVHHADGTKTGLLVICQDDAYHKLLHQRMRAHRACGHSAWRKCWVCKRWDDPLKMFVRGREAYHIACKNLRRRGHLVDSELEDAMKNLRGNL